MGYSAETDGVGALPLPPESQWALVERVAAARTFSRSARLRDLLLYVGRQTIFGDGANLREAEIGARVFGRPEDYDTGQDNIVRVNFTELRKRVQQYFTETGDAEPYFFDIPRGTYRLHFAPRAADAFDRLANVTAIREDAAEPDTLPPPMETQSVAPAGTPSPAGTQAFAGDDASTGRPTSFSTYAAWALAGVVCLLAVALLLTLRKEADLKQQMNAWTSGPGLQAFWKPFFAGRDPADIVLADSSMALAQDMALVQVPLSEYLTYNTRSLLALNNIPAAARDQAQHDLALILSRNSGSMGDFRVAMAISQLAPASLSRLYFAREYSPTAVREHNAILLGSSKSNPWAELFEDQMEYRFSTSPDRLQTFVTVVHPRPQEVATYAALSSPDTRTGYCVVAVLPNLGSTGSTLLIEGTDSQATEAAGEFLTSDSSLQALQRMLGNRDLRRVQLLLETRKVRGTPLGAKIISFR